MAVRTARFSATIVAHLTYSQHRELKRERTPFTDNIGFMSLSSSPAPRRN